ncbi:conserved protein of unknown function [Streptantibioticus cattleyicolor NRRL 8057 = DSM 46488]|nr:DUF742 domain-containing protein [Streptomyces sp. SID5468]CCB75915.1 conserved protein of unknown function [Streptantibioticus cattleyicolor NRRL 8057 = DSM 46488]
MRRRIDSEDPDRLYTVTGGRSRPDDAFDLVTLIVSECGPAPGMQSEHARILRMCERPTAVVEISAELGMPVSVVKILLGDLLATGRITARHPQVATVAPPSGTGGTAAEAPLPDPELLKQVLVGLQNL